MDFKVISTPNTGNTSNTFSTVNPATPNMALNNVNAGFSARYVDVDPENKIGQDDLINDEVFIDASRVIFKMNEGREYGSKASDEGVFGSLGEYGIGFMGYFNYNLPKMALEASYIRKADDNKKAAFLYMMEAYDDLGMSWSGTWRFAKGVAFDPTTYVGLSTFGLGLLGRSGAKATTKELVKSFLRGSTVVGTEGAIYTGTASVARQVVEGEGVTVGRTVSDAKWGLLLAPIGGSVSALSTKLTSKAKKAPVKEGEEAVEEAIDKPIKVSKAEKEFPPNAPASQIRDTLNEIIKKVRKTTDTKPVASAEVKVKVRKGKAKGKIKTTVRQNLEGLKNVAEPIAKLLRNISSKTGGEIVKGLESAGFTSAQMQVLGEVAQQAFESLTIARKNLIEKSTKALEKGDIKTANKLRKELDEVDKVADNIDILDKSLGANSARALRARQESIIKGDLPRSVREVMERDNLSKIEAEKVFVEEVAKAQARFNTNKELRSIDQKIIQLSRSKSKSAFSKIIDLKKQKEEIKAKIAKEDNPLGNPYEVFNKAIARPLGELLIGLVFSPSTVIINTVPSLMKTIYKPFINYVAKSPLDGAAFKGMTAEYSAMWSMIPTALKSARFAFIHEQAILTGNYNRLFETVQDHALPGWFGQAVRLFPRSLLATDAFFEQINYKGYIVGSRTAQAIEEGQALNYSGKKLNDYVSKEVTKAVNKAYDGQPNVVDELVDVAIKKGLSGKKADIWARKQLANNKDIFRKAQNQEGKSYVQDLLFKRDFSGKGFMSKSAQTYESFVQKHPVMRLAGQLFFRTPVRVFEEGLRLTPGLNVINPRFIADLRGKNGLARQVRANGEAMLSYAMVGAIFTLYMQGKITGAGPKDYKQKKMLTMSGGKEPYSIELTDGTDWVYRNFDPFATPIKIIVNALEQAELVKYRTEQGENIDNTTFENSVGAVAIGFMSIAQAIRDANLTGGIKEMTTLFEDLQDPESSGDLIKYTARKMQSFIPSTWFKYKQLEDFQFSDPKTFEQFIQYRYNPGDPRVPRRYSPLGIPEELSSPMTKFNIFDPITREERFANRSDVEIKAEKYLYKLSQVLDTNFIPPYKMEKYFGDKDLRELKLEDGTTVYDRWQQLIRESRLSQAIAQIADRNPPYSTPSNKSESIALTLVNEQISMFREIALLQILRDMPQLKDKYREFIQTDTLDKVLDMSGQSDVNPPNLNY